MERLAISTEHFEFPSEAEDAGPPSLEGEYFELGSEAQPVFTEMELEALAAELLSVSSEAEMDQFLGKVFKKIGRAAGKGLKSLGRGLKALAPAVLPILGRVAGTFLGGPAGAMIGSKLGSLAGKVVKALEVEGFEVDGQEFEVAKRFVEFAGLSAQNLAASPPGADESAAATGAMARAAGQLARLPRSSSPGARPARSRLFGWLSRSSAAPGRALEFSEELDELGAASADEQMVREAIARGERNENTLTDLIFHRRHPERGGRALSSTEPAYAALSTEWLSLRDSIVRPLLQAPSAPGTSTPAPGGTAGKVSVQRILRAMARKGYRISTEPYRLNIVGIRSASGEPDRFDDSINVFYKDKGGRWILKSFVATTDPGLYWLNNPMRVEGTAIVAPGQYPNSHAIGTHHGTSSQYTALVQRGPITVIRDFDEDDRLDFDSGRVQTGLYGINIHRASATGTSSVVDQWSAGCQVFASSSDFAQFMQLAQQHAQLYGNTFTYTLLEEGDV
jgi:hypothetical protein